MNSSLAPKVSVCIPVYNGSAYIAESINSVLAQTYEDFHLIVCDNCSTDNTEEIVRSFRDPRLTYVRNAKNLGLVGNSNRCLDLAKGEYVCILHHDDVMLPENLERKVRLLDERLEVGFVHSNIIVIDSEGEVFAENIWHEDSRRDYIEKGQTVFRRFLDNLPMGTSIFIGAVLARRSCYEHIGGFSPELPHCTDSEMWMRMLLFYDVACIGTPLVKYRAHMAAASGSWGDYASFDYLNEHYAAVTMIFEKYKSHIPNWKGLKKQVSEVFGKRALTLAANALIKGDFVTYKIFLKEADNISPWISKYLILWKTAIGMIVTSGGIKISQGLKKIL